MYTVSAPLKLSEVVQVRLFYFHYCCH